MVTSNNKNSSTTECNLRDLKDNLVVESNVKLNTGSSAKNDISNND